MDTQEFTENLQTWLEIYRDNKDVNAPIDDKNQDQLRWETGMLRVCSAFRVPEAMDATPAKGVIAELIEKSKTGDRKHLPEIYEKACMIEKFLKGLDK
ncbi:MAG TPA: hypothetical protein PLB12_02335 [Candidatus Goldiibacteriota bacterium]|nr:hypothetical protein [Candidatus Goldiibacteriota bacterium]HPI04335.1 hypothetical protein [Candidatus Goldiibacteriota bacterium]HPN64911.1 hypothetical protein [Candidatus Goldiibacteriota bacterium]HRQ43172.1 hypothetical protein [Candidatus Goldiibacteriota bacterium]